jgi:hypothetical protein
MAYLKSMRSIFENKLKRVEHDIWIMEGKNKYDL